MVLGIDTFKRYFEGYQTRYVIIGGTACNLVYAKYGVPERTTRDIDMVIVAEAFDSEFYKQFVRFIHDGGYQHRDKAARYELYRFDKPSDGAFPLQVELLSRRPEYLRGIETDLGHFRAIDASGSLSAILLDDEYYNLLDRGIEVIDGLPVLSLEFLPVFKIHAWSNLMADKAAGKVVHSDEINKHRRDVLRLCSLFRSSTRIELPKSIAQEIERFVDACPWDDNMIRNLHLRMTTNEMAELIRRTYVTPNLSR